MEQVGGSFALRRQDLICPITLDIYRDPVLAQDGHVYERAAIVRWIEQQGTSPLTREPLDVSDLCSEGNIRQLCQSHRRNSVTYSCHDSMVSLSITQSRVNIDGQTSSSEVHTNRRMPFKQCCTVKRTLLITLAICCIVTPCIVATSVILFPILTDPDSPTSISAKYPTDHTYPPTIYKLPNNCTLETIVRLLSWNNVQSFNYTYYSKLYRAVSNQTIITFAFRHDPSYWCLDDVSVIDISLKIELVKNGNFENNPPDGFFRCNSDGTNSSTLFLASSIPHNGNRSFCDGTVRQPDYLSQLLNTTVGQVYLVSFWLQNLDSASNNAQVIMSY